MNAPSQNPRADGDAAQRLAEAQERLTAGAVPLDKPGPAPEILYARDNPSGTLLEPLLEQVIADLQIKQHREPDRCTALVITHLETALLWQIRRSMHRGLVHIQLPSRGTTGGAEEAGG